MAKKTTRRKTNKKTARKTAGRKQTKAGPAQMSVAELTAELRRRQRGVRTLERRRDQLMAQLQDVNAQIAEHGGAGMGTGVTASGKARNTSTLPDALYGVLQGTELSVTEAADAVRAAGYVSGAANFRTMVNQALIKDKRFKKVRRGVYTAR